VPKSICLLQDELSGEIDEKIKPLVMLMRELGFNTISSCEGHFRENDFKHARPNIIFTALDRGLLHAWVREVAKAPLVLPVGFSMGPTWNPDTDVVHEDNWGIEMSVDWCETPKEARTKRDETVKGLCVALRRAAENRPLATDSFVRSRW
jgi:hypothetical protein